MEFDNFYSKTFDISPGPFEHFLDKLLFISVIVIESNIILSFILKQKSRGK